MTLMADANERPSQRRRFDDAVSTDAPSAKDLLPRTEEVLQQLDPEKMAEGDACQLMARCRAFVDAKEEAEGKRIKLSPRLFQYFAGNDDIKTGPMKLFKGLFPGFRHVPGTGMNDKEHTGDFKRALNYLKRQMDTVCQLKQRQPCFEDWLGFQLLTLGERKSFPQFMKAEQTRNLLEGFRDRLRHRAVEEERQRQHAAEAEAQRQRKDVADWLRQHPRALEAVVSGDPEAAAELGLN